MNIFYHESIGEVLMALLLVVLVIVVLCIGKAEQKKDRNESYAMCLEQKADPTTCKVDLLLRINGVDLEGV